MTDKWNLITQSGLQQTKKKQMMEFEEDHVQEQKMQYVSDNLFERKKRKHGELELSNVKNQPPLKQMNTAGKGILQIKQIDQRSNLPDEGAGMKKKFPQNKNIQEDTYTMLSNAHPPVENQSLKILSIEALEKYLNMDEKFIDNDRNIAYGSQNQSILK
jgi:hypothetical protein